VNLATTYSRDLWHGAVEGWNRFWFRPAEPHTLCMIRVLAGLMLFYTHLVWTIDLEAFFGPHSWIDEEAAAMAQGEGHAWSYFWLIDSSAVLWAVHGAALVVFAMLALGWHTRLVSIAAYLMAVAYVNRVPGALFGLDQINLMLAMYLMVGPAGACYSLDRWRARRRAGGTLAAPAASVSANVATRLIQVHMCVIYFFAGISKLQGETWWRGDALWGAFANLEYQTLDMTWLAGWPVVISFLTHLTVYWEVSFCALVWPRLTRPIVLAVAIPLHLGIAFAMGMITFGLVMLIGCLSFVSPTVVRWVLRDLDLSRSSQ